MTLTNGHTNLTKLNETASCICGRFCNENQHTTLDRNFISLMNFILFLYFQRLNTPDVKYHIREDHSNST